MPVKPFPGGIAWSLDPSGPFVEFASGDLRGRVYKNGGHLELAGPDLAGQPLANVIRFAPPAVQTSAGNQTLGAVLSSKVLPNGLELVQQLGAAHVVTRLTFPHEGVMRYEVVDFGVVVPIATALAARSDGHEQFYGFGEKFDALSHAGKKVHVLTFDDPGTKGDHSYKVAPWFMSTRGFGFHLDSSAESSFDMRASAPDHYVVTHLFSTLRFNVVYGPRLTDVLARYTGYTGRPPLPPPWTFGPWISSDIWRSGGEVRYAVTLFRRNGLPASAFVFDSPWEVAYNDFTFNRAQFAKDATIDGEHFPGFASIADMLKFLQTNGLKVICWMAPFVNTSSFDEHVPGQNLGRSANYDTAANEGVFVRSSPGGPPLVVPWWKGHGSPIDFTREGSRQWLRGELGKLLAASQVTTASGGSEPAIGGFKVDDGESTNGPNTYIPKTASYADGRTGIEMRNGYAVEYHRTVAGVLGAAGILFARSGFVGSQAFPGCWAGDNEPNFGDNGLPSVIVAGQTAAMSGYAIWGHDVGGYQDTNFSVSPPNLFMRWAQFACFSPIMQMHRQVATERQYPWRFGAEALDNFRFFATLHVRLFPYLYTYAKLASTAGLPIIRPLVLLDQTDPNTFDLQHTYLLGNELLVAPMIRPNAQDRQVYLPPGGWIDFFSNERHAGGQNIAWHDTNQAHLPVFAREGAVIPFLPRAPDTLCDSNYVNAPGVRTPDDALLFRIYPSGQTSFTVYDGTELKCEETPQLRTLTLTSTPRPVVLEIVGRTITAVTRDGTALPELADPAAFDAAAAGWRSDAASRTVSIKFAHTGGVTRVQA